MEFFFFGCDWENVNLQREGKEKEKHKVSGIDDVAANVAQQKRGNNKYYTSTFKYIYIYIYIYIYAKQKRALSQQSS